MADKNNLAQLIAAAVNKDADEPAAFFLNDIDNPANIKEWVSTGSSVLDLAISNRPNCGLPVGRITEITGLEQSGKSLICAHLLANCQKAGGIAILIDTENAAHTPFFEAIGLDVENLVYIQAETIEDVFTRLTSIIEFVRKQSKDKLITICVDSIAGASTKAEIESDYDKDGYATGKAIILGKAMRKITNMIGKQRIALVFTNQLRYKMNAMAFGEKWTTSGGKAVAFHSSVRIRLQNTGQIKETVNGEKRVTGRQVKARIDKNRLGPPLTTAEFEIYFDSGIDDYASWIRVMKTHKIISGTGRGYTYVDDSGTEHKFKPSNFVELLNDNPHLRDEMYGKICDVLIMEYKSDTVRDTDAIEVDDGEDGDDE